MGEVIEGIKRETVVRTARAFILSKFRHQGRSPDGMDCAGLVILVGRIVGALPEDLDITAYSRRPDGRSLVAHCKEHLQSIRFDELALGDIAVFRVENDPQHLAIVGDHPFGGFSLIHAYAPARKVVENRFDESWTSRLVAAFRFHGIEV